MQLHEAAKTVLLTEAEGGEAFDKFDDLYLKNHKSEITKLHSGGSKEDLGLEADKAEEIFQFWDMHQKQIADRIDK